MKYDKLRLVAPWGAILRTRCEEVSNIEEEVRGFLPYLIRIMRNEDGMSISANQIGINKAVFVLNVPGDHIRILINPTLVETSGPAVEVHEGCLSFPGKLLIAQRKRHAVVHAFSLSNEQFYLDTRYKFYRDSTSMLMSACIQHEMDHMNGIDMREYLG